MGPVLGSSVVPMPAPVAGSTTNRSQNFAVKFYCEIIGDAKFGMNHIFLFYLSTSFFLPLSLKPFFQSMSLSKYDFIYAYVCFYMSTY